MNAVEILGAILSKRSAPASGRRPGGQQSGGSIGGLGRDILQKVLEEKQREKAVEQARHRTAQAQHPHAHGGERLEHILHDANGRWKGRKIPAQTRTNSHPHSGHAPHRHPHHGYDDNQLNERAVVLIRAMVNAAKADGQIDKCEQDEIVGRLGHIDSAEAQFLQQEFRRPLDIHAFAHDVPRGMEEEVYAISLMAIDLDTRPEAHYLTELATCLRLDPQVCNNIHAHYGAPQIFR